MASNPPLLSDYVTQVQRLLHDASANYWSVAELTDYINTSRFRVVAATGCNRTLQTVTLTTGTETYAYSTLPSGVNTFDVLNISVLWGSLRVPCNYMPWTEFNLKMRAWQSFESRPIAFSVYGGNTVYIGPVPDQNYTSEWDTVVAPSTLSALTDVDTISFPYTEPVPYYAAYLAKFKSQNYDEAQKFLDTYGQKVQTAIASSFTRRITQPFNV